MKALLDVGEGCNNCCTFCHTQDLRDANRTRTEVDAKIDRARALGCSLVVLTGGEPAARPEILHWAARARARGLSLGLVTNGRMLAYRALTDRLIALGLQYVELSLQGGTADVHNRVVRTVAFDQTMQGLNNLVHRGLDLTVTTVVTPQNMDGLRAVVDVMQSFPDAVLRFSMARPKEGDTGVAEATPDIHQAAHAVSDAIGYGLQRMGDHGPTLAHEGFPLCLLPGYTDRADDLKNRGFIVRAGVRDGDYVRVDDRTGVYPEGACGGCALRGRCPGVPNGYATLHGDVVLNPVTDRPQSNSYNYTLEGTQGVWGGATYAGCPVWQGGVSPWDRGRVLFVLRGDTVTRVRTLTRDFSDEEIARTVHTREQVYLDVSEKPAPDDFPNDLVQLRRSPRCGPCPSRAHCAGLFERVAMDVFTRDDTRVRGILATLVGDVLDVGCGDGPYEDLLEKATLAGMIRYVGIDPDEQRVDGLRARWPWAEVRRGTAEMLVPAHGERFDHILVLRSWNHLREPVRAAEVLHALLRPGGRLTVVDNVAFGLVRSEAQVVRAEGGPARFEHYRNDGAVEAIEVLETVGFRVVERRDVGPGTSNQWFVRCARGEPTTGTVGIPGGADWG